MAKFEYGDKIKIKTPIDWPMPPGFRFAGAHGTVVPFIDWEEIMAEFKDVVNVRLDKVGESAEEYIGNIMFFHVDDLEKI